MNNKDLPAMPSSLMCDSEGCVTSTIEYDSDFAGLTKQEMFAMHAMQGMLSNTDKSDEALHAEGRFMPTLAINALEAADALLAALETE